MFRIIANNVPKRIQIKFCWSDIFDDFQNFKFGRVAINSCFNVLYKFWKIPREMFMGVIEITEVAINRNIKVLKWFSGMILKTLETFFFWKRGGIHHLGKMRKCLSINTISILEMLLQFHFIYFILFYFQLI